jgi:hypothetical protein
VRFSRSRNGVANFVDRTLPRREASFSTFDSRCATLAAQRDSSEVAQEEFDAARARRSAGGCAKPVLQWLAAVATANESEDWGVDYLLRFKVKTTPIERLAVSPRRLADLEEVYHTRSLRVIVGSHGFTFELREPPRVVQLFIRTIARSPDRVANLLLVAGEVVGTIAFRRLLDEARVLPMSREQRALACELLDDTLADEIGHVTYLLGSMGRAELVIVRALLPLVARIVDRSFVDSRRDRDCFRGAIRDYSLAMFDDKTLDKAFVPSWLAG